MARSPLTVANLPPGLSVRPGRINPGQTVGALTISSTPEASVEIANLKLIGEGAGPTGPIFAMASKSITLAEQGTLATNVLVQEGLPASTSLPTPITLESPSTAVEAVHGYGAIVPIKATRLAGTEDAVLTFGSLPLPAGFTVGASNIPAKAVEGGATINAAPEAPLGPSIIAPGPPRARSAARKKSCPSPP